MRKVLSTVAMLMLVPIFGAFGQSTSVSGAAMPVDDEVRQRIYGDLRSELRNLLTAQEAYFSEWATYGREFASADRNGVILKPSPGITVTISYATKDSHSARATHAWLPGRSCVIFVGAVEPARLPKTASEGRAASQEGAPVCDAN